MSLEPFVTAACWQAAQAPGGELRTCSVLSQIYSSMFLEASGGFVGEARFGSKRVKLRTSISFPDCLR
jgi:hypothetical protein